MKKNHLVSVVITTKNEERNIKNCLESVKNQTYKNIEIIVVDNNSTDKTKEIAKKYTSKVFDKGPERSAQRNYGVEKSSGEFCLLLDADQILPPKMIYVLISYIDKHPNTVGIQIPEKIIGKGFWIKVRDFEKQFYDDTVIDVARFLSRDAFLKAGSFDLSMTGPEDWDLDRKIKNLGNIGSIKLRFLHNERLFNMKSYLSKKRYYSRSFETYKNKWNNDNICKKQFGLYYRLLGVFFENRKWKRLLAHPILTIAMYYLKIRIGLIYLSRNIIKK